MLKRCDAEAVGAGAARVAVAAVAAVEVLHESHGEGQDARARTAAEKQGVADAPGVDAPYELPLQLLLSCDVRESHRFPNVL